MATTWEAKGSYVFEGGNCIGICDTDNASTAQYERNARLMAAAPDLLEALKELLELTDDPDNDADPEESVFAFARQAISKATGGK